MDKLNKIAERQALLQRQIYDGSVVMRDLRLRHERMEERLSALPSVAARGYAPQSAVNAGCAE